NQHFGMMVLSTGPITPTIMPGMPRPTPKKRFKKLTEIAGVVTGETTATEFEPGIPVRRWPKLLPLLPAAAQLIISRAFFRVFQHFIGFAQTLEMLFSVRFFTHIRMIFAGRFAVGTFDIVLGSIPGHPQDLIVILKLHRHVST